jgi:hypothetical protein
MGPNKKTKTLRERRKRKRREEAEVVDGEVVSERPSGRDIIDLDQAELAPPMIGSMTVVCRSSVPRSFGRLTCWP